jgi:hypothetical protein
MHRYLEVGLKYLFNGKRGRVEIVVANSENGDLRNDDRQYPPWSVCKRIEDVLYRVGTMNFVQNFLQANDAGPIAQPELQPVGQIIPRSSFADFIEKEMD